MKLGIPLHAISRISWLQNLTNSAPLVSDDSTKIINCSVSLDSWLLVFLFPAMSIINWCRTYKRVNTLQCGNGSVAIRLGRCWRLFLCEATDPGPNRWQGSSSQVTCVTSQWLGWHSCYKAAHLPVGWWLPANLFWFVASRNSSFYFGILGWEILRMDTFLKQQVKDMSLHI
jgi:hypothetical protein